MDYASVTFLHADSYPSHTPTDMLEVRHCISTPPNATVQGLWVVIS
jgi:hypothetical protein